MSTQLSRRHFLRNISAGATGWGFTAQLSPDAFAAHLPWKAGLAQVLITPQKSLWMGGYASRTKPSEGVEQDLYAKALALEDPSGKRAVLVTSDLLGLPAEVSHNIAEQVGKKYHLTRNQLLLSSSHTHSGPVIGKMLGVMYPMNPQQWTDVDAYTRELESTIVKLVGASLKSLHPARLSFGHGKAGFAMNRRERTDQGVIIGVNKEGPVDHDVPVLRIDDQQGKLRGVVFGYACHNTTAGESLQFTADYAGFAQSSLQSRHPGATALFLCGCGGDANPYPRGTMELARQHGGELAASVEKVLARELTPVQGPLKTAYEEFPLAFATPPNREELEHQLQNKDVNHRNWAGMMLKTLDRDGHLPTEYPYPLEIWQFGEDLTFVALGGEAVVDYDLRLKKEIGAEKLWVGAYCNDVFAYIPSLRVLKEGGYEGGGAMIYYGQPGPFAPNVEETIIGKVHDLIRQVGNETS